MTLGKSWGIFNFGASTGASPCSAAASSGVSHGPQEGFFLPTILSTLQLPDPLEAMNRKTKQ
jgi:hypothetical protein